MLRSSPALDFASVPTADIGSWWCRRLLEIGSNPSSPHPGWNLFKQIVLECYETWDRKSIGKLVLELIQEKRGRGPSGNLDLNPPPASS